MTPELLSFIAKCAAIGLALFLIVWFFCWWHGRDGHSYEQQERSK